MSERERARLVAWAHEMQRVHARLRQAVQDVRAELGAGGNPELATDLLLHCRGFCIALEGHHRAEDAVLFPAVRASHPHLRPVLDRLTDDHVMIADLVGGLQRVLDSGDPAPTAGQHLDGLAAIMENHFRYEERQLTTILAELDLDVEVSRALGTL